MKARLVVGLIIGVLYTALTYTNILIFCGVYAGLGDGIIPFIMIWVCSTLALLIWGGNSLTTWALDEWNKR